MAIPKPKVFWPLIVSATNNKVYFREGGITERTGTVASGTYFSAATYFAAVVAAMNAAATGTTFAVAISAGFATITATVGAAWRFSWGVSTTNAAMSDMGWVASNTADAVSQVAPRPHANGWYSPTAVRSLTPDYREDKNSVVTVSASGLLKSFRSATLVRRDVTFAWLPPANTLIAADLPNAGRQALESWWLVGHNRFRFWPDGDVEGTFGDYFFDLETLQNDFAPSRMQQNKELYSYTMRLRRYVG